MYFLWGGCIGWKREHPLVETSLPFVLITSSTNHSNVNVFGESSKRSWYDMVFGQTTKHLKDNKIY